MNLTIEGLQPYFSSLVSTDHTDEPSYSKEQLLTRIIRVEQILQSLVTEIKELQEIIQRSS